MKLDLQALHEQLQLTPEQAQLLGDALEQLMHKYEARAESSPYMAGVADGLNHARKLVMQVDDDYNSRETWATYTTMTDKKHRWKQEKKPRQGLWSCFLTIVYPIAQPFTNQT